MEDEDLERWADDGGNFGPLTPVRGPEPDDEVLLYRIEDAKGYGPFQGSPAWGYGPDQIDWDRYNEDTDNFPSPRNDPGFDQPTLWRMMGDGHIWETGCCSVDQLRHWFDERTAAILARYGYFYTIWRARAEKAVEGAFQAVFDRRCADCLERLPADRLYAPELPLAA